MDRVPPSSRPRLETRQDEPPEAAARPEKPSDSATPLSHRSVTESSARDELSGCTDPAALARQLTMAQPFSDARLAVLKRIRALATAEACELLLANSKPDELLALYDAGRTDICSMAISKVTAHLKADHFLTEIQRLLSDPPLKPKALICPTTLLRTIRPCVLNKLYTDYMATGQDDLALPLKTAALDTTLDCIRSRVRDDSELLSQLQKSQDARKQFLLDNHERIFAQCHEIIADVKAASAADVVLHLIDDRALAERLNEPEKSVGFSLNSASNEGQPGKKVSSSRVTKEQMREDLGLKPHSDYTPEALQELVGRYLEEELSATELTVLLIWAIEARTDFTVIAEQLAEKILPDLSEALTPKIMQTDAQVEAGVLASIKESVAAFKDLYAFPGLSRQGNEFYRVVRCLYQHGERDPGGFISKYLLTHLTPLVSGLVSAVQAQLQSQETATLSEQLDTALFNKKVLELATSYRRPGLLPEELRRHFDENWGISVKPDPVPTADKGPAEEPDSDDDLYS